MSRTPKPTKPCAVCGRVIEWRKKWERDWENVKYCSKACGSGKLSETDQQLESAILELLEGRAKEATICPSEAARVVSPQGWKELMEDARRAARRLVFAGKIQITQQGRVVDPSRAKGPIRLRKAR